MFWDVHSHVVPSGDDGVASVAEGLSLCREAAARGTSVLYATPHVWPHLILTEEREEAVRAAHAEMAPRAAEYGLELGLGFELTPDAELLEQDLARYRLGELPAVLVELPFAGPLDVAERVAEAIEAAGLVPVVAHPERADEVIENLDRAVRLAERGWLLQLNATSVLGYHGPMPRETAWALLAEGAVGLVGSDGHRAARPPYLDEAFAAVRERVGEERARPLFDGSALRRLAVRDGLHLAERG